MKKTIIIFFIIIFASAAAFAGDSSKRTSKRKAEKDAERQYDSALLVYNNLELAAAYWQEAWKNGSSEQEKKRQTEIEKILWDDIFASLRERSTDKKNGIEQKDDSVFKVKHSLFKSFKKGETFAHKYRIVSDYRQILKEQVEQEKIELAETENDSEK